MWKSGFEASSGGTLHKMEIDYTIGIAAGLAALMYKDGPKENTFKSLEITTQETALGSAVSVLALRTIDTGGEMFGFLPQIGVPSGQTAKFSTVGVSEKFGGPDSFPHLLPSWNSIELHGTAQTVGVPV